MANSPGPYAAASCVGSIAASISSIQISSRDPPRRMIYRAALLSQGDDACLFGVASARMWQVAGLPQDDGVIEVANLGGVSRRRLSPVVSEALDADLPPVVVSQVPVAAE